MRTHMQAVQDQFDPRAEAYLTSVVHAAGPDLAAAAERVARELSPGAKILDVGTGAGHLSFALAPWVPKVVALDPAPEMLGNGAAGRCSARLAADRDAAKDQPPPCPSRPGASIWCAPATVRITGSTFRRRSLKCGAWSNPPDSFW